MHSRTMFQSYRKYMLEPFLLYFNSYKELFKYVFVDIIRFKVSQSNMYI
jgi:hypothetical protein